MSERLLAAFSGPVESRYEREPPRLVLSGFERGPRTPLQVLINAPGQPLPTQPLADAEIYESIAGTNASWSLRSGAQRFSLPARSVQVHRDAALALASVLPPQPLTLLTLARWRLLLVALRVPGMVRMLRWFRG